MASVTPTPPISHSGVESTVGFSYVFAAKDIDIAMSDALDVMGLGLVRLVGGFEGSGSDTMRVEYIDGVGFDLAMTAVASETDSITPSAPTLGYTEVALAQYGLGFSDTYKQQLLSRQPAALVDYLVATIPQSWTATLRSLVCTAGSTFATGVGAATTSLSIDDLLDLAAARRNTSGARIPIVTLHGTQINQAIESARQEPAYQSSAAQFLANTAMQEGAIYPNFLGLGFTVAHTNDVVNSGGGYVGFASAPGGIGWAGADPSRIKAAGMNPIKVPDKGLLIEEITDGAGQSIRQVNARAFLGVAIGDPLVFFQRKVTSINT
jgi:hypothetical protein